MNELLVGLGFFNLILFFSLYICVLIYFGLKIKILVKACPGCIKVRPTTMIINNHVVLKNKCISYFSSINYTELSSPKSSYNICGPPCLIVLNARRITQTPGP